MFSCVGQIWLNATEHLWGIFNEVRSQPQLRHQLDSFRAEAELIKLCFKVLHGFLLTGFQDWTEQNGVLPFLKAMLDRRAALVEIRAP